MPAAHVWLFFAVLAQVGLTLILYPFLLRARIGAANRGEIDRRRAGYDPDAWPRRPRTLQNAVASQFELPVLFYAGAAFAIIFGAADWILVVIAWVFALSRLVHAIIHVGPNRIYPRLGAFLVGWAAMVLFWAYLAVHMLSAAAVGG